MSTPSRAAAAVFALLVAATFGAFFVAQRLKHTPGFVQYERWTSIFSPNGDGFSDDIRLSFAVTRNDRVNVELLNRDGDAVRALLRNAPTRAGRKVRLTWDGRTDAGGRARDGLYRVRVTLRDEGRTVVVRKSIRLDTTPPRPRITAIGPAAGPGPELLPNTAGQAKIHFAPAGRFAEMRIYRTAPGQPRLIARWPLARGATTSAWSGRARGQRVPAGTYLAVVRWRDRAGNLGTSAPLDAAGRPVVGYGTRLPGRGGITVRYLEIEPPVEPVPAGRRATVFVDARRGCYDWSLRRPGGPRVRRGRECDAQLRVPIPSGEPGLYLLEARTRRHVATAPIPVTASRTRPILVVLPVMTWQGRNPLDDDGDGLADTLDRGVGVRLRRVLAGGRLPSGFADAEGPLLAFLKRHGRSFDLTTDVALAQGRGPQLEGHRGVLLPGDVRWLPGAAGVKLRRWVQAGGNVLATGLGSLRREVAFSPSGQRLIRPTAPSPADLFGARLGRVVGERVTVTGADDALHLFTGGTTGGTGLFVGFPGYEPTIALGPDERMLSQGLSEDGRTVIVAARVGTGGLVIRTGLLRFADRLSSDGNSAQLLLRAWQLIGRAR